MRGASPLGWKTRAVRRPPPPLSRFAAKLAKPVYQKFGFSETHIFEHWADIVGDKLARRTLPQRLSNASGPKGRATLTIRVDGAAGLELQHLEPQVLERINGFYGYAAVGRLRFVQGPLADRRTPQQSASQPLSASEQADLDTSLASLAPGPLKSALAKMGEQVRRRTAPPNKSETLR